MEAFLPTDSNVERRLLAETRMVINKETDPTMRAGMLAAAIAEGDLAIAEDVSPFAAYAAIGEVMGNDSEVWYPRQQKIDAGLKLVEALATRQQFDDACHIATDLTRLATHEGSDAKYTLLRHGYAGSQGELLDMFTEDYLLTPLVIPRRLFSRKMEVERYLNALVAYGIDITQPDTPHKKLLDALMRVESDPGQKQQRFKDFAVSAAQYQGGLPLAFKFKDAGLNHSLRADALLGIGEYVDDPELLSQLLAEVHACLVETVSCGGACGHTFCSPQADEQRIALGSAGMHARLGDTSQARQLLDTYDDGFHFSEERMQVYSELYAQQGKQSDRQVTLELLNHMAGSKASYTAPFIKKIVHADLAHGNVLSVVNEMPEIIPRFAWELQTIFGRMSSHEEKWMREDTDGEISLFRALVGPYDERAAAEHDSMRRRAKDQTYATLIPLLVEHGAPHTAEKLLRRIDDPIEVVRAKTAVALKRVT